MVCERISEEKEVAGENVRRTRARDRYLKDLVKITFRK